MYKRLGIIAVMVFIISACGEPTPPKRGAVENQARIGSRGYFTLRSSLNCAYPGEEIVFTLTIENANPFDLELVGTPVIEIVLTDGHTDVRWSDDPTYPSIERTLKQGEKRTYEWRWKAQTLDGSSVAKVIAEGASPQGNPLTLHLSFGINTMTWDYGGSMPGPIKCSELR